MEQVVLRAARLILDPGRTGLDRLLGFRGVHADVIEQCKSAQQERGEDGGSLDDFPEDPANHKASGVAGGDGAVPRKGRSRVTRLPEPDPGAHRRNAQRQEKGERFHGAQPGSQPSQSAQGFVPLVRVHTNCGQNSIKIPNSATTALSLWFTSPLRNRPASTCIERRSLWAIGAEAGEPAIAWCRLDPLSLLSYEVISFSHWAWTLPSPRC